MSSKISSLRTTPLGRAGARAFRAFNRGTVACVRAALILFMVGYLANPAGLRADSLTWDGAGPNALWSNIANWGGVGNVPGNALGQTATFNSASSPFGAIDLTGGVTIGNISFSGSTVAYTLGSGAVGSQTLTLENGGSITLDSAVVADQTINANLVLGEDASGSTYTLDNDDSTAPSSLIINGGITGGTGGGAGAKTLAVTGTGGIVVLNGIIANGGATSLAITKSGSGTLTLGGPNTFTGGVTLSAGTLNINNATALGTGTLVINGNSTIGNTSGGTITVGNAMNWNSDFAYAGPDDLFFGTGAVTLGGNRIVTVNTGTLGVGGAIGGGAFSLTKAGTGTLSLSGANTFTGGLTINAGTVRVSGANAGALGAGNLALGGGSLSFATDTGSLAYSRPTTVSAATTITVDRATAGAGVTRTLGTTLGLNGSTLTVNGGDTASSGTQGLIFSGNTTIVVAPQTFTVNNGLNSRTLLTLTGTLGGQGPNLLTFNGTGDATVTGAITGTGGLTHSGSGILTLSAANTALTTGTTTIGGGGGTVRINNNNSLGATAVPVSINGGTLAAASGTARSIQQNLTINNNFTIGEAATGTGSLNFTNINLGAVTRTITVNNASDTISGAISGSAGAGLVKAGSGILVLTNVSSALNTYSGPTEVRGGQLRLIGSSAAINLSSGVTVTGPGSILMISNNATFNNLDRIGNAAVLTANGGNFSFVNDASAFNASETIDSITLNAGALTIDTAQAAVGQTSVLTLGGATPITRNAGGTVLFRGTGFGVARNTVVTTAALTGQNVNGILPYAFIQDGALYNLAVGGGAGLPITQLLTYDTSSGDPAWLATVNARPSADLSTTVNKILSSLVLDAGIDVAVDLAGAAQDRTNTFTGGAATILQTGGTSVIGASGVNEHILAFGATQAKFYTVGDLVMQRGNGIQITGTAGLVKSGPGALILQGTNSITGTIYINEGNLVVTADAASPTGNSGLGGNGNVVELNGGGLSLYGNGNFARDVRINTNLSSGVITGFGGYGASAANSQTNGLGRLTLGTSTRDQTIIVRSAGTTGGAPILGGGAWNDNNRSESLTFSAVTLGGNGTFDITDRGSADGVLTVNGAIDDGAGGAAAYTVTKVGSGTLVLNSSANNWTGITTVSNGGALRLAAGANISSANLILNGANLETADDFVRDLGTGANQVRITGGQAGFSGRNTVIDPVTVSLGGGTPTALTWGTANFNPSVLELGDANQNQVLTFANAINLNGPTAATERSISVTGVSQVTTNRTIISGNLSGTGSLLKTGSGVLELTGTLSYDGPTRVTAGMLRVATTNVLPSGNLNLNANNALGVLEISGTFARPLGTGNNQVNIVGTGTDPRNGFAAVGGALAVNIGGALATLNWDDANFDPNGATTTSGGLLLQTANATDVLTLQNGINLNSSGADLSLFRRINVQSATVATRAEITGVISDTGATPGTSGLQKRDGGLLALVPTSANTYSGATEVGGGTLAAVDLYGISGANLSIKPIAANNRPTFAPLSATFTRTLGAGAGEVQITTPLGGTEAGFTAYGQDVLVTLGGGALTWGSAFFNPGALLLNDTIATHKLTLANNLDLATAAAARIISVRSTVANDPTTAAEISGIISDTGAGLGLTKTNNGVLILSGNNSYAGGTLVFGGTIRASHNSAFGPSGTVTLNATATGIELANGITISRPLTVADNGNQKTLSLLPGATTGEYSGTISIAEASAGNFRVGAAAAGTLTVSGIVSGTGVAGFTKEGAGIVILNNAANAYTGVTTVSNGTLIVGANAPQSANGALGNAISDVLVGGTAGSDNSSLLIGGAFTVNRSVGLQSGNTGVITLGGSTANPSIFAGDIRLGTSGSNTTSRSVTLAALAGGSVEFTGVINENTSVLDSAVTIGDAARTGTVNLSGVNQYGGITLVTNGATLEVTGLGTTGGSSVGNSARSVAGNLILSGSTLKYTGAGENTTRLFTYDVNGGIVDASGTGPIRFTGASLAASGSGSRTLTLTGANTGANTMTSLIVDPGTGSTAVSKTGAGNWILNGANTYSGATTIGGGTLTVSNNAALGTTAAGTTVTAGALQLDGTDANLTIGAEALTLNGSGLSSGGALRSLAGNNSYAGVIILGSASRINADAGTLTLTSVSPITDSYGLTLGGAGNIILNGAFAPTTAGQTLTKDGVGTVTLAGGNTYTAGTFINAGTLRLGAANSLADAGDVTVANGTFDLNGNNETIGALTLGGVAGTAAVTTGLATLTLGGNVTFDATANPNGASIGTSPGVLDLGGATRTFAVGDSTGAVDDLTVSTIISGAPGNGLTKTGAGTLVLSGANLFGGITTVNGGTVKISSEDNLGANPGAFAAGHLTLDGGTLQSTASFYIDDANRGITLGGGGGTFNTASGTLTIDNVITGGALTKSGTGGLTITSASTATGLLTIDAGTLTLSGANGSLTPSSVTLNATAAGTSLVLNNTSGANNTDRLADAANITINVSGGQFGTINFANDGSASTFTETLGNLTLAGSGGNVTVNADRAVGGTSQLTFGSLTIGGGIALNFVGTGLAETVNMENEIRFSGGSGPTLTGGIIAGATINGTDNATWTELVSGYYSIVVSSVFTNDYTHTYGVTAENPNIVAGGISTWFTGVNANPYGPVQLGSNAVINSLKLTREGHAGDTTPFTSPGDAGIIDLNGQTLRLEAGTLRASATNGPNEVYSHNVIGGTLTAGTGSAIDLSVITAATNRLTIGAVIADNGAGVVSLLKSGLGTNVLSGANTYSGNTTVAGGILELGASGVIPDGALKGNVTVNAGATLDLNTYNETINGLAGSGTVDNTGATASTLTVGANNAVSAFNGILQNSGASTLALTKIGTGTLILGGANTYSGNTAVSAGTLQLGAAGVIPDGSGKGNVSVTGTLDLNTYNETINGLAGSGTVDNTGATASTLTVGANNAVSAFNGILQNSGASTLALTKTGTGVLTLGGANTYSGNTVISGGTLLLGTANVIPNGVGRGNVSVAGTLDLNAFNETINGLTGAGTVDNSAATASTLSVGDNNASSTFAGTLTDSGASTLALDKIGTGALTLSGNNTHAGGTTLTLGQLNLDNPGALGTGVLTIAGVGTLDNTSGSPLTLANANLQSWNANFTFAGSDDLNLGTGAVTLGANRQVTVTANTLTVGGIIDDGAFSFTLTKEGLGTLLVSGANTYEGLTTVNDGTLKLGNAAGLGAITAGTLVNSGGVLDLNGQAVAVLEALNLNGSGIGGAGALINSSGTAASFAGVPTLDSASTIGGTGDITLSGVLSGSFGLTKEGAGTLTLTAQSSRNSTALGLATTLNAGTLILAQAEALNQAATARLNFNGGKLQLNGTGNTTFDGTATVVGGNVEVVGNVHTAGTGNTATLSTLNIGAQTLTASKGADVTTGTAGVTYGAVTLTGASVFNVGNGVNLTLGAIGPAGFGMTKTGLGLLTLGSASTFAGGLAIKAGTVQAGNNANALGANANVVTLGDTSGTAAATLQFQNGQTYAQPITVAAGSSGTKTIYGGLTTGDPILSGPISLNDNLTLAVTNGATSADLTVTGGISGTGNLTLGNGGTGTITLSITTINPIGSITNSGAGAGGVTISSVIGGNVTTLTQNSPTSILVLSGANQFTGKTTITAGVLSINTIANVGGAANSLGQPAAGPDSVIDIGTGGTLRYNGVVAGVSDRVINLATAAGGTFTLEASGTTAGSFTLGDVTSAGTSGTSTLTLTGTGTGLTGGTISGIIADGAGGTTALTKTGAGTWTLSGANTYTGINTITTGTLQVNNATDGLGDSTAVNAINLNGGTLSLRNNGAGNNGTIIFGSTGNPLGYNVQIAANSTINVDNLTANTGNTIDLGPLTHATVAARTLNVTGGNGYILRFSSLSLNAGLGQTTTLNPTTASIVIAGNVINPMTGFAPANFDTLVLDGTSTGNAINGVISDAVGGSIALGGTTRVTKSSTSTWTLSGANVHTGNTLVSGGTLALNNVNAVQNSTLDTGTSGAQAVTFAIAGINTYNLGGLQGADALAVGANTISVGANNANTSYTGILSGVGGQVIKTGSGQLQLNTVNTFTGGLTLNSGTLATPGEGTDGVQTSFGTGTLTVNGGTLRLVSTTGAKNVFVPVSIGGDFEIKNDANTGDWTFPKAITLIGATRQVTVTPGTGGITVFSGAIGDGASGYGLTKAGAGTLRLSGANTYTGDTTISAGTLELANGAAIDNSGKVIMDNVAGATLQLNNSETIGDLSGGGATGGNVNLQANTLTVNMSTPSIYDGAISGTGGLAVTGNGSLTLNNANTFSGPTAINGVNATLIAQDPNSLGSTSAININDGTLLFTGAGSTRINDGAAINLGGTGSSKINTAGMDETMGVLTMTANSVIDLALNSVINGSILNFANSTGSWTGSLQIWNWDGPLDINGYGTGGGVDQINFASQGLNAGQLAQISFYSGSGTGLLGLGMFIGNEVVPTPEPATWASLGALGLLLGWRERRRLLNLVRPNAPRA